MKIKIGIVDTMFARVNMGMIAIDELKKNFPDVEYVRRTVPGIKDIAVECKRLLETDDSEQETGNRKLGAECPMLSAGCDVAIALGMVGGAPIDTQCAHEASLGLQQAKLMTNKHIIEVFVHENEAWSERELLEIFENRTRKHVGNAVLIVRDPESFTKLAGLGIRQGKENEGSLSVANDAGQSITLGVVVAKFNDELTGKMEAKAQEVAKKQGVVLRIIRVPGVYDMPLPVKKLLMDKSIAGVVTLGAVVMGETSHDELITKDTVRRLGDLSLEFKKPVTLGIIGHNVTWEQAEKRAEDYAERAVMAAIDLIKLLNKSI